MTSHRRFIRDDVSLRPAFDDQAVKREALYWEHMGERAIRGGDWKLVSTKNNWQLYDLKNDPIETHDLSTKHPDRVKTMTTLWETWAKRSLVK